MGRPNSLPITESLSAVGYTINFPISMGSTETVLSLIDGLSEYFPGFDYRVSYDREFTMWSPYRFGDPDDTADDGPIGANIAFALAIITINLQRILSIPTLAHKLHIC